MDCSLVGGTQIVWSGTTEGIIFLKTGKNQGAITSPIGYNLFKYGALPISIRSKPLPLNFSEKLKKFAWSANARPWSFSIPANQYGVIFTQLNLSKII
nr:hypothetical protein [uncultured Desulfobulbus sp.]